MVRILVQNRRPVVPNVATNSISDAAIVAWNGFPESDTQSMVVGGWIKYKIRTASYPSAISKGAHNTRGVEVGKIQPNKVLYAKVNKAGSNSSDEIYNSPTTLDGWSHAIWLYKRTGFIYFYFNGKLVRKSTLSAGWQNGEWWTEAGVSTLVANCTVNTAVASLIFASTDNPNKVLATDEQILALYEIGAIPPDVIYWPMDEGNGSGAGTCKAYVNGVNVPALDGNLNTNSWVADSPFN